MAQPTIQTSFASGEWAPKLRSRVDIQKYRSGAALLRNFYVDFSGGGASTRQGFEFLSQVGVNGARLVPFQPASNLSYVLEFGNGYIRFYSNGAQIMSGGVPYQIASPYAASDLFPNPLTGNPGIKFVQDVTSLIICHPNYQPQILTIISPTNWTLTTINFGATIGTPPGLALATTLSTLSNGWSYGYTVTAVDVNNQESAPATLVTINGYQTINNTSSPGTNTVSWSAVPGAISYNVYKASPTFDSVMAVTAPVGFIGNTTALAFTDTTPGFGPDFSQGPPIVENPFVGAGVQSATITNPGSYAAGSATPTATIAAPASGSQATAQPAMAIISSTLPNGGFLFSVGQIVDITIGNSGSAVATIEVTAVNGFGTITSYTIQWAGAFVGTTLPSNNLNIKNPNGNNADNGGLAATWGVGALNIINQGSGYTSVPAITFSSGAAAATAVLATASAGNPGVPGFIQERLALAAQPQAVQTFNLSQPNSFFNFNTSFPVEDDDAIQGSIISSELNDIRSLTSVPTGLLALTGKAGWLINGGAGISTQSPITPSSITAQPQAFNGANDLDPLKVNMDVLYATNKGCYVRDLTYNLYAQIFTGNDISVLSNHLFFGFYLTQWCWSEEPFKTVWAVRNDGQLLSLAYVKDQDMIGWAHHDTNGQFKSVCSVIETTAAGNIVDAVYVIVERTINGSVVQNVERMADRYFPYGYEDSWSVDCALQTAPQLSPTGLLSISGNASAIGNVVTLTDTADSPFTSTMASNNWIVRAGGGIYQITGFTSTSVVTANVVRVPSLINPYTNSAYNVSTGYTIWQPITSVSGLTQLLNTPVVGVADGTPISGTVSNTGTLALGGTYTKVTIGLQFTPQLQALPLDLGEPTVQGKRKKITALTLRVADTLGLSAGKTFSTLVPMKDFTIGNVPTTSSGVSVVTDLVSGDGRTIIDQDWDEAGNYCVQQNQPYPATILGVMPEVVVGDTK